jgi:ligand-binding sensor domain-containing protein
MKQFKIYLTIAFVLSFIIQVHSQAWKSYSNGNNIQDILADGNTLWVATTGGLAKIDLQTLESEIYTKSNSGLPFNILQSLAIDNDHNLWIGTQDHEGWYSGGLVKFDGTNWTVYNSNNSELPIEDIRGLAVDQDNNVWIGTFYGGAARFDGTNWTVWDTYPWYFVQSIAVDDNNNVWMGTENAGLLKFDGEEWITYNTSNSGISSNDIQHLEIDNVNNLWIATWGGYICKFNGSSWSYYNGCFDPIVYSLTFESSGVLWAVPQAEGLAKFDYYQWTNYQTINSALPEDYLLTVETDIDDNVWVGTWKFGLGMFQDSLWLPVNTSGSGLSCNWVKKIITDWNGYSYILTYYNGVTRFDGDDTWQVFDSTNSVLPSFSISDMDNAGDSLLWFTTWKGLISYDNSGFTEYNTGNSGIPNDTLSAITIDHSGIIWIGINGKGLARFDGNEWFLYNSSNSAIPINQFWHMEADSYNNIWIATQYSGLVKFDGNSEWETFTIANSNIPDNDIRNLYIDENDLVYACTYYGGLGIYDGTDWTVYDDTNAPFYDNWVQAAVRNDDDLWVGTRIGLYKLSDGNWTTYMPNNSGLPNKFVLCLANDIEGKIWIGMYEGGLAVYDESLVSNENPGEDILRSRYIIQPNPFRAGQDISIRCPTDDSQEIQVEIYSLNGQKLLQQLAPVINRKLKVSSHNLPAGIYVLKIVNDKNLLSSAKLIAY